MLDQDNNSYLISLSILITFFLIDTWTLEGEVSCLSLVGVKELKKCTVCYPPLKLSGVDDGSLEKHSSLTLQQPEG